MSAYYYLFFINIHFKEFCLNSFFMNIDLEIVSFVRSEHVLQFIKSYLYALYILISLYHIIT